MTWEELLPYILVGILGAIVFFAILYRILRFLRGSVKIHLAKKAFGAGESVTGTLAVRCKKKIEGNRLFVALICSETREDRVQADDETQSRSSTTREVYRDEVELEGARSYDAGFTKEYPFTIARPADGSPGIKRSGFGAVLAGGLALLGGRRRTYRWRVDARLDAKGIDLASSRKLTFSA